MNESCFTGADILLPRDCDMQKWSVVACDQYTAEPEYWQQVEELVGDAPSTLKITLPEIYLEQEGVEKRIQTICSTMNRYLLENLFTEYKNSVIYLERTLKDGRVRKGLVGRIDLEQYSYYRGDQSIVRPTEGTVLERIPPRVKVREDAPLELPHVMLLIDDPERTVIEPIEAKKNSLKKVYDFALMMNSGSVKGYLVDEAAYTRMEGALLHLMDEKTMSEKYGLDGVNPLLFAVGDGNHSLATAKACYEQLKEKLPKEEWENHPARYALVEVVNLHDESLEFEPIHRVVFDVDPDEMLEALGEYYDLDYTGGKGQTFSYVTHNISGTITIKNPRSNLTVGSLQLFIDDYLKKHGGRVDYIHGEEVVNNLGSQKNSIGFLLPGMRKDELFKTVMVDGVLPRKTFSMGHACDKRFYLECREIK